MMRSKPRLSRTRLPRLAMLVLIAVGVLLQPVVAAVGQLHDLSHASLGVPAASHAEHGDLHGAPAPEPDGGNGTSLDMHALMHVAQCCGQLAFATAPPTTALQGLRPASKLVASASQHLPRIRWTAPFRPPITT